MHHLEKKVVDMEEIENICASKEAMHEDHARRAWCAYDGATWGKWVQQKYYNNFWCSEIAFDMQVKHHEMLQFISTIETPSL